MIARACEMARRHGLRFAPRAVEIRIASNLCEHGLNGEADWGARRSWWVQAGLPVSAMTRVLPHELCHAYDALHEPTYDEWPRERQEARCHAVAGRIMLRELWTVPS
ncbi:MAG: hypothetical protein R2712_31835 [Vicinamibacterales bacterium]